MDLLINKGLSTLYSPAAKTTISPLNALFKVVCNSEAFVTLCVTGVLSSTSLENQVVPYFDLSKIFGFVKSTPTTAPTVSVFFLDFPNKSVVIVLKSKPLKGFSSAATPVGI